jgi:trimethylamine:corrinoid methyltransferase-like protein
MVTDSISSVAKTVTYYARDPEKDFFMEKGHVGFSTFGEQVNVIDLDTRQCRNTIKEDCNNIYSLIDALDGLAWCQRTVCPGDQRAASQAVHNFQSMITHNSKHIGAGVSDSKVPDAQAGYEFTLNALPLALSGANMIFGAGGLETGLTFDYAKLIMDHECITNILKLISGVKVDHESMVLDLIDETGPGGTYLTHPHTFQRTRSQSQAVVFDRKPRAQWLQSSKGKDITEKAYEKARQIIENHKPLALAAGAEETIKDLVADFEADALGKNR